MKLIFLLSAVFIAQIYTQDITNKLGASGNYNITDSSDNSLFQVTSDGDINAGGDNILATYTFVGSDQYGMTVSNGYIAGIFTSTSDGGGVGIKGNAYGPNSIGVTGYGNNFNFFAENAGAVTDYGSASSIRWKKNIIKIDNPLEKLSQIRGVYFDWDEQHGGGHDVGCIAEEIGKILPEIVVYEENGIDANGMDYSKLTPLLIEAVNAQQKIIEDLQNRITTLENK